MTITEQALKGCPFCGEEPKFNTYQDESNYSHNIVTFYQIYCCHITIHDENKQEATKAWNTRADDAELEELRVTKKEVAIRIKNCIKNIEKHDYYMVNLAIEEIEELLK